MIPLVALLFQTVQAPAESTLAAERPVRVWLDTSSPLTRGAPVRVYLRANEDGHLVVLRKTTDGRIQVLFPGNPADDPFVRAGTYEIRAAGDREAFVVAEPDGTGWVLAALSPSTPRFDEFGRAASWNPDARRPGPLVGRGRPRRRAHRYRAAHARRRILQLRPRDLHGSPRPSRPPRPLRRSGRRVAVRAVRDVSGVHVRGLPADRRRGAVRMRRILRRVFRRSAVPPRRIVVPAPVALRGWRRGNRAGARRRQGRRRAARLLEPTVCDAASRHPEPVPAH